MTSVTTRIDVRADQHTRDTTKSALYGAVSGEPTLTRVITRSQKKSDTLARVPLFVEVCHDIRVSATRRISARAPKTKRRAAPPQVKTTTIACTVAAPLIASTPLDDRVPPRCRRICGGDHPLDDAHSARNSSSSSTTVST